MSPLERIAAAFAQETPDEAPFYIAGISSRVASELLGREVWTSEGTLRYREVLALRQGGDAHRELIERSRQDLAALAEGLELDIRPRRSGSRWAERVASGGTSRPSGARMVARCPELGGPDETRPNSR
ncbi:MAG: hypothetical protein ACE5R4_17910 [Armatimonadota bacterium]